MDEREATALVTELYERWYIFLVRYAYRSTENFSMAEDLAQETFCELYRSLRNGKTITHPKAWTLSVLKREMNREITEHSLCDPLDNMEIEGGPIPEISANNDLQNLLSVLTPREAEVLLLRLEPMKYREIADHLGISANSVNTHLARALRKLQQAVSDSSSKGENNHVNQNTQTSHR